MAGESRSVSGTHRLFIFCLPCCREGQQVFQMAKDMFIHFFKRVRIRSSTVSNGQGYIFFFFDRICTWGKF